MESSLFLAALMSLLTHIPVFVVWLVGAMLALFRPGLPKRVVGFLVGGLAAHFVQSVIGTMVSVMLPRTLMQNGSSASQVGVYLGIWSAAWSIISAAAWVLILLAVFAERQPSESA